MERASAAGAVRIAAANTVPWDDLLAVIGSARCHGGSCFCQRFKIGRDWRSYTDEDRAQRLEQQSNCGHPQSRTTSGLIAYVADVPAGWCAVEPRSAYQYLSNPIVWAKREEDRTDDGVWALTCFVVGADYRRAGLSYELAAAAVDHARESGARALEGYPMRTVPGQDISWGELHVGAYGAFVAAGFTEVRRATKRRVVMRIDLVRGI